MIKVAKDYLAPPHELKVKEEKAETWKGIVDNPKQPRTFLSERRSRKKETSTVRTELRKNSYSKCVYCEDKVAKTQSFHIEHYRSKKLYPWLVYEWSNLLMSCSSCNEQKSDDFPIQNEQNRVESYPQVLRDWHSKGAKEEDFSLIQSKIIKACRIDSSRLSDKEPPLLLDEDPLSLNPEWENPEDHFSFLPSGEINKNKITEKGKVTIELCKLDRSLLAEARKTRIEDLLREFLEAFSTYNDINKQLKKLETVKKILEKNEASLGNSEPEFKNVFEKIDDDCRDMFENIDDDRKNNFEKYVVKAFRTIIQSQMPDEKFSRMGSLLVQKFNDFIDTHEFFKNMEAKQKRDIQEAFQYWKTKIQKEMRDQLWTNFKSNFDEVLRAQIDIDSEQGKSHFKFRFEPLFQKFCLLEGDQRQFSEWLNDYLPQQNHKSILQKAAQLCGKTDLLPPQADEKAPERGGTTRT